MKAKTTLSLLAITGSIIITSCCKMECIGNELIISFENYRRAEVDTLFFIGYERNTNFSKKIDSVAYVIPNAATDTFKATNAHTIIADKDWRIKIPRLNKEFKISNYEITTARCECGNKKYALVNSFDLNGATQTSNFVVLPR